jgi:6-pyruvoyltetrahydropterin/6-carboxytetrahydropterin synthase
VELRIDGWRKGIRFSASHLIPGHAQCGRLHGHTYAVHCVVRGDLRPQDGFVVDFHDLTAALGRATDALDHRTLLPRRNPALDLKESDGEVSFRSGGHRYVLPRGDVVLLDLPNCSAEHLAQWMLEAVLRELRPGPNVHALEVGVDEGYGKGAWAQRSLR